jgi:hypothetical protein
MWKLEFPAGEPDTTSRRILRVAKSFGLMPAQLESEMVTEGSHYTARDYTPEPLPTRSSAEPTAARRPTKTEQAITWLRAYLSTGPAFCEATKAAALEAGIKTSTLDDARKAIGVITEGAKGAKLYRLPMAGEQAPESDNSEGEGPDE